MTLREALATLRQRVHARVADPGRQPVPHRGRAGVTVGAAHPA
jgi:hypothetical protein